MSPATLHDALNWTWTDAREKDDIALTQEMMRVPLGRAGRMLVRDVERYLAFFAEVAA
jgi:hypothetical protein